jgi:hypothetical protein
MELPYNIALNNRRTIFAPFVIGIVSWILCVNIFCANEKPGNLQEEAKTDGNGSVEKNDEGDWFIIKSGYMTIYCAQDVDLKTVANRLSRRGLFVSRVYDPNPVSAPAQKIAYLMDRLLKKAKEILDMWPAKMNLKVKIFKDRDALNDEYARIFGQKADYKAFFIYKYNTIYSSEEDISDSVLVHEMGHAIVDHYFSVIPPEKVRELLASYVDLHLED